MGDSLALGIDLGTGGVRVAVINQHRDLLYSDSTDYDRNLEYPDDWRNSCIQLIQAIPQELRAELGALAVDGTSGPCWPATSTASPLARLCRTTLPVRNSWRRFVSWSPQALLPQAPAAVWRVLSDCCQFTQSP